jgi:hypothetical protein
MRPLAAALAIPLLVGVPLWVETSRLVAAVALAGGAVCLVALLRASLSLATVGGALTLFSLTLALRSASSSADVLAMVAFGSGLLLLVEAAHWGRRFDGASVTPALWHRAMAWWTVRTSISFAIAIVLTVLAPVIAISLAAGWAPFVAGIGVLMTFAAAVAVAWAGTDDE